MAQTSTLYRFRIELSDVDRGVYAPLDFRVAMHPSESFPYLVTRVLAYALNTQEDLNFAPGGLSDPDSPCLLVTGEHGAIQLWIEIGNPSGRKLHKAAKASKVVKVYTYKDPALLLKDVALADVHKGEQIEIYSLAPKFLDALAQTLERNNDWSLLYHDSMLTVTAGGESQQTELLRHSLL